MTHDPQEAWPGTVSVVLPLYNKADYVIPTLRSVLDQTRGPDEIVIVDDGSTDDGPARIAALDDPRIRVVRTGRPQSGPSAARNAGVHAARGAWIAFLDADDFWKPEYLERVGALLAAHPGAIAAFSSWELLYADGSCKREPCGPLVAAPRLLDLDGFINLWERGNECPMWTSATVIARATLLEVGGFPEEHWRGEDKDTWLRVMAAGRAIYTPEALALYNQAVEGQVTKRFKPLLHPVSITIRSMLDDRAAHGSRAASLRRLSNLMIWQYTRLSAFRSHLPASFVGRFHPRTNPVRFAVIVGVFAATRMGIIARSRSRE